ncbi:hypothetical protein Bbelb_383500 [Branchiostoma belcheri]|nr:hypothetical protein Bbelb_383500 [Branchiostoma belcheri]
METLSSEAYDLLSSFSYVNINNNPWLCDCGMLPVKQRMTETLGFEQQITCAGPEHLAGKSLLFEVDAEDLNCEDTGTGSTGSTSTAPAQSFSLSAFLGGLGVIPFAFRPGMVLKEKSQNEPSAPVPDPSCVTSNQTAPLPARPPTVTPHK